MKWACRPGTQVQRQRPRRARAHSRILIVRRILAPSRETGRSRGVGGVWMLRARGIVSEFGAWFGGRGGVRLSGYGL